MIYTNMQASFNLSSVWKCVYGYRNGRVEWYIASGPTASSSTVTFDVALPADAVIQRAWLTMGLSSPLSGAAYKRVNDISISSDGVVDVEGITAETTSFEAVFSFKANGVVFQNSSQHSASLTITDPTLHIEYDATSTPDEEPDEETEIISQPTEAGVQLPRLLDADLHEAARITPISLDLSLELHPLSKATMHVPTDGTEIKVRDFLELFSPHGSAGIFRVTETGTRYGGKGMVTLYLEHALCTLADSLVLGAQAMSAPVATVISTLLECQNEPLWALGDCEVPEDYELIYEYSYQNLLQALMGLTEMIPGDYAWEFDTTHRPFLMHLRLMPEDDACECRMNRNLSSAELTMDSSNLCTRVIPFGAGEGTDRVSLTHLIGSQHMDSDNTSIWGYVSRTFTQEDIFDALTLRDVAERYLERHDHPLVSVTMDAMDLSEATGEPFDRFHLGRRCRLILPEYGIAMHERVITTRWPDVYGNPERVDVTLANRIRDASDEIAELMREATNSKLLGGKVETIEETSRAGSITPGSPFVHTFEITGYGNVLNVRISYTCTTDEGASVDCIVAVDGTEISVSEESGHTIDITRDLSADENGVPIVGEHKVRLQPKTVNTMTSTVSNTVTIKQIKKG